MFRSTPANDAQLMGAEITYGKTLIGHVEGLIRDPISQRVWRLITSYGLPGRRVGVPMEWVVNRSPTRLILAVGASSLDDLSELDAGATGPGNSFWTEARAPGDNALENAASVAGMILSTEALVTDLMDGNTVGAGSGAQGMYA